MTKKQKTMLYRILITFVLFLALVISEKQNLFGDISDSWYMMIPFLVPYLIIGYDIILKAFRNIKNGQVFDENFLMMIATVAAFAAFHSSFSCS